MFRNREAVATSPGRALALDVLGAGIDAAHPTTVLQDAVTVVDDRLTIDDTTYDLGAYNRVLLVGAGKAAGAAAATIETLLAPRVDDGTVVTTTPQPTDTIEVIEASHPIPDDAGVSGADRIIDQLMAADESTLVLAAITGGGSALLPAPAGDLTLADLQAVTRTLLGRGLSIQEVNTVRKHLSRLKGGRLAVHAAPATVVGIVFSDVVGDDPSVVASGPFSRDETNYRDAQAVLDDHDVDVPDRVCRHLEAGVAGTHEERPTADASVFDRVSMHVLADAHTALEAARSVATEHGVEPMVLSATIEGEARDVGRVHAAVGEQALATGEPVAPPAVVLSAGESTVTIDGECGSGGPNQESALGAALQFVTRDVTGEVVFGAVDTDGNDGATEAAGAIVDPETVTDARGARTALRDHDVTPYLRSVDALLITGPTGTNVNDLRVLVVGAPPVSADG